MALPISHATRRWLLVLMSAAAVLPTSALAAPSDRVPSATSFTQEDGDGDGDGFEGEAFDPDSWMNDGEINAISELGPGSCSPAVLGQDESTTCRFPLLTEDRDLPFLLSLRGREVEFNQRDGRSRGCFVERDDLVCPDLIPGFSMGLGEHELIFDLYADNRFGETATTIEVDQTTDGVLGLSSGSLIPTFWSEDPGAEIGVFRSFQLPDAQPADLLVRGEGEDAVLVRLPGLESGEDFSSAALGALEPGRYSVAGCAVAEDGTCEREGYRRPIQVIAPVALPLVEETGPVGRDLINLVFYGSGFRGVPEGLGDTARRLLSLDGEPVRADVDGTLTTDLDVELSSLGWGPFSVEPLRSSRERFAFWYLADDVASDVLSVTYGVPGSDVAGEITATDPSVLGLEGPVVLINISLEGDLSGSRARANEPTFTESTEVPDRPGLGLGSIYLPISVGSPTTGASTLTHELGHAIFDLRDEYVEPGVAAPRTGYPNCPRSVEQAEAWWGDLMGVVDPMTDVWFSVADDADLWYREGGLEEARDLTRIAPTIGPGCASESSRAVRPSADSMMSSEIPVFGAVNRRRAEEILNIFTGRAMFAARDHLALIDAACVADPVVDPELVDEETELMHATIVRCTGEVAPLLDVDDDVSLVVRVAGEAETSPGQRDRIDAEATLTAGQTTVPCVLVGPGAESATPTPLPAGIGVLGPIDTAPTTISCEPVSVARGLTVVAEVHVGTATVTPTTQLAVAPMPTVLAESKTAIYALGAGTMGLLLLLTMFVLRGERRLGAATATTSASDDG